MPELPALNGGLGYKYHWKAFLNPIFDVNTDECDNWKMRFSNNNAVNLQNTQQRAW